LFYIYASVSLRATLFSRLRRRRNSAGGPNLFAALFGAWLVFPALTYS
jgi:hypothetical protein